MDPKPPPTPGTGRGGTRPPVRRRHPAARSRVVAGALSAVLFLGLGAGMAANQTAATSGSTAVASAASSSTASDAADSNSSSWAATPGSSSDQSTMTTSQGS
jgi:hypothetical protein